MTSVALTFINLKRDDRGIVNRRAVLPLRKLFEQATESIHARPMTRADVRDRSSGASRHLIRTCVKTIHAAPGEDGPEAFVVLHGDRHGCFPGREARREITSTASQDNRAAMVVLDEIVGNRADKVSSETFANRTRPLAPLLHFLQRMSPEWMGATASIARRHQMRAGHRFSPRDVCRRPGQAKGQRACSCGETKQT